MALIRSCKAGGGQINVGAISISGSSTTLSGLTAGNVYIISVTGVTTPASMSITNCDIIKYSIGGGGNAGVVMFKANDASGVVSGIGDFQRFAIELSGDVDLLVASV